MITKKDKRKIKNAVLINFLLFLLALFIGGFLKMASVGGVILIIATFLVSVSFNGRVGLLVGSVNIILAGIVVFFYYKIVGKPFSFMPGVSTFPLFLIVGYFTGKYNEFITKLREYKDTLESKIQDRTRELEEARTILEIKVKARTKELEELAEGLEKKVKERTKELGEKNRQLEEKGREIQKRIEKLEKFTELTVGRELHMIELKKEIESLKNQKKT